VNTQEIGNIDTITQIEEFMSELVPADMLTVELIDEQTFYIYVDQSPSKIKIAFSV